MQGNCDTPKHLTTTNSQDKSIINVIPKRLEGLKGTFAKMVEKTCSQHDDNIMEMKTKSDFSQKTKRGY